MQLKKAFLVGRRERGGTTLVILRTARGPIVGPWTLKAVVSKN